MSLAASPAATFFVFHATTTLSTLSASQPSCAEPSTSPDALGDSYGWQSLILAERRQNDSVALDDVGTAEPGLPLLGDAGEETLAARLEHGHVEVVGVLEGVRQLTHQVDVARRVDGHLAACLVRELHELLRPRLGAQPLDGRLDVIEGRTLR